MGIFLNQSINEPFEAVLVTVEPCLFSEGYRLMTNVKTQNEYRRKKDERFRRFAIFEHQLKNTADPSGSSPSYASLQLSSNVTLREREDGGTEVVGFDPTLPFHMDKKMLETGHRRTGHLLSKIEDALRQITAHSKKG